MKVKKVSTARLRIMVLGTTMLTCQVRSDAATVFGIVRNAPPTAAIRELEEYPPLSNATVTLCAPGQIYRTQVNKAGEFRFEAVLPDNYQLVAKGNGPPMQETVRTLTVSENEGVGPITVLLRGEGGTSPCAVTTAGANALRDFDVTYSTPEISRGKPEIKGRAFGYVTHSNGARSLKPLANAVIQLISEDKKHQRQSTSDKNGGFQFQPDPGLYSLRVKAKGFYEVVVDVFRVPTRNTTIVETKAAPEGAFTIQR